MKKHAIIPIFLPHIGCPHDCVFCNQKKITARLVPPSREAVIQTIESHLKTIEARSIPVVEIAFYGGSFTGIPMDQQIMYLTIAKAYKDAGRVSFIHLSTRPDFIDETILNHLKSFGADIIELGVQSFDEDVLKRSGRGHDSACIYKSSALIKEWGFTLGLQLMIGLPGDTRERCLFSAGEAVKIGPAIARLYPTVVIQDTELYNMFRQGAYTPFSLTEAVEITKEMCRTLRGSGINVIRIGLKSSDIIKENGEIEASGYHPAMGQLVESAIAREDLECQIRRLLSRLEMADKHTYADGRHQQNSQTASMVKMVLKSSPSCFSNMIGHKGDNKKYFTQTYPHLQLKYMADEGMPDYQYKVCFLDC